MIKFSVSISLDWRRERGRSWQVKNLIKMEELKGYIYCELERTRIYSLFPNLLGAESEKDKSETRRFWLSRDIALSDVLRQIETLEKGKSLKKKLPKHLEIKFKEELRRRRAEVRETTQKMKALREKGLSNVKIAEELGVPVSEVAYYLDKKLPSACLVVFVTAEVGGGIK